MLKNIIGIYFTFYLISFTNGVLEPVQDDELLNLIKTEKYVIVLFSSRYCESCENYDNELTNLREDLVETLNAWVVKAVDSQMVRLYSRNKEPVIVFFRHGIPLLYDGPLDDELILHTFTNNKEPVVRELTDDTFEHLTQAATGATTGDWFIMFYSPDCIECQRLQAIWEAVGAHLKSRMNVARVNRGGTGAVTARRFNIFHVPTFIFFRQGQMYSYQSQNYDVTSFVSFAKEGYQAVKSTKVPLPKSAFDDFTAQIRDYIRRIPLWYQLIMLVTFTSCFLVALAYSVAPGVFSKKTGKAKKKPEKSEEKNK